MSVHILVFPMGIKGGRIQEDIPDWGGEGGTNEGMGQEVLC